jgi:hypothetical protein
LEQESGGKVCEYERVVVAYVALNISSDVMIFQLPWPLIKGLQIRTRQKIALV